MRRLLFVAGLLLALPVLGQDTADGSVYTRFGIGELRSFSSSQIQALGGGGVALPSLTYVNFSNPAAWSSQALTRVSAGVLYQNLTSTNAAGETSQLSEGALNAIHFSFPIWGSRMALGVGFEPYSRVGYRVQVPGTLSAPARPDDAASDYLISYVGTGGLQQVRAGVGYRVATSQALAASVGLSVNGLFGLIEETRRTEFFDLDTGTRTGGFTTTNLTNSTRLRGLTATAGAQLLVRGLAAERDLLSVGATVTLPTSLDAERARTLGLSLDRDTLGAVTEGTLDLPASIEGGVAYRPDDRWTFVTNALYEPWSSFESDLTLGGYAPGGVSQFQDRMRMSGGLEFFPAGGDLLAPFLARTAYRLGLAYDRAYVEPLPGESLRTLALTGGISLPALVPGTRLDINMEAGTRGTTDAALVRDRYLRVLVNVNFGERWFEERRLR